MNSIEITNLSYRYNNQSNFLFKSLNLEISGTKTIGIIGTNGCGKSTLLRLIAGLLHSTNGKIIINNQEIKNISDTSKKMLYIPENSKLFLLGPTVNDELKRVLKRPEHIEGFVKRFNVHNILFKKLYHLSEGQRRLLAILLSFHFDRDVYLYDEPTIAFDKKGRSYFIELLKGAKEKHKTVFIATNDSRILPFLDILIFIKSNQTVLIGDSTEILYKLEDEKNLIPNQTVRVLSKLIKGGLNVPKICTVQELNHYIRGKE